MIQIALAGDVDAWLCRKGVTRMGCIIGLFQLILLAVIFGTVYLIYPEVFWMVLIGAAALVGVLLLDRYVINKRKDGS